MTRRVGDAGGSYQPGARPLILLDTCVVLWITAGQVERLSPHARKALERHRWAVSAMSIWEITIKSALGNLTLPSTAQDWWPAMCDHHGMVEFAFTSTTALRCGELPLHHRDPFDRSLIATAIEQQVLLVSPDPLIAAYRGIVGVIW